MYDPRNELAPYMNPEATLPDDSTTELATKPEVIENALVVARRLIGERDRDAIATYAKLADDLIINDGRGERKCDDLQQDIGQLDTKIKRLFEPKKSLAHRHHKALTTAESEVRKQLKSASDTCSRKRGTHRQRARAAEAAEAAKVQAQLQREAQAARDQHVEDLADAGRYKEAEQVQDAPDPVAPPVILQTQAPKDTGSRERAVWKHRTTNPELLPREYLLPNEPMIRNHVKARGEAAVKELNGAIEVYEDVTVRTKRR